MTVEQTVAQIRNRTAICDSRQAALQARIDKLNSGDVTDEVATLTEEKNNCSCDCRKAVARLASQHPLSDIKAAMNEGELDEILG